MKFTNAKPILEMTRSEADTIYKFFEFLQDKSFYNSSIKELIEDFTAQYEGNVDSACENLLSFILKIKN